MGNEEEKIQIKHQKCLR